MSFWGSVCKISRVFGGFGLCSGGLGMLCNKMDMFLVVWGNVGVVLGGGWGLKSSRVDLLNPLWGKQARWVSYMVGLCRRGILGIK